MDVQNVESSVNQAPAEGKRGRGRPRLTDEQKRNRERISIQLPVKTYRMLQALADAQGVVLTKMCYGAVIEYLLENIDLIPLMPLDNASPEEEEAQYWSVQNLINSKQ